MNNDFRLASINAIKVRCNLVDSLEEREQLHKILEILLKCNDIRVEHSLRFVKLYFHLITEEEVRVFIEKYKEDVLL